MEKTKRNRRTFAKFFFCGVLTCAFIYSCNNDEFYGIGESAENERGFQTEMPVVRAMRSGNALLDSVANSKEVWEFKAAGDALAEKYDKYVNSLDEEEYDELMAHQDDDEYMEEVFDKVDIEKELQRVEQAQKNLHEHTGFLRLSEEEQTLLFEMLVQGDEINEVPLLKTRQEGSNETICEKNRKKACERIEKEYLERLNRCVSNACREFLMKWKNEQIKAANDAYNDCMNNR